MTLLCPLTANAADVEELSFEIAEYNEAAGFLTSFGIISRTSSFIDTDEWTVSRGEFTAFALECIGVKDAEMYELENPYLDVAEDHPYRQEILYATHCGYIGGDLGRFFQPDIPLTAEFAARLGVNMTGRDVMLGAKSCLSLAASARLFDKVQMYDSSQISRGGALMFMKNTLTAELVTYKTLTSGGEKRDIRVEKGANLLSSVLKYEKRRGILTSDGLTTVYGSQPGDGYVTIDSVPYLLLFDSAAGLAGKMVEYYVTDHEGGNAVKYIEEYRNTSMTIAAKSLRGFDPVNMVYSALIEGEEKNIRVSRSAYISFNHQPYYDPEHMKPLKGAVTFIDHNGDDIYDALLIEEFTNTVVDYYSNYADTIFDLDSRLGTDDARLDDIDLSDVKNIFLTDTKNNYIEPGALTKNSIISVYKSSDGTKIRLIVSSEKITGVLGSIDDEGNVTIGEQEYRLSQDFRSSKSELRPGAEYGCYLDARGDIAYMTTQTGIMAYLINAEEAGGIAEQVKLQVIDEEKKQIAIYTAAKKVRFRTPSFNQKINAAELLDADKLDKKANFKHTMCMMELNAEGEIASITTAMDIDTYDQVFTAPDYPLYELSYLASQCPDSIGGSNAKLEYKTAGDHFSRWIVTGSGSQTFYLPPLKTDGSNQFEDNFDTSSVLLKHDSFDNGDTDTYDGYFTKDLNDVAVRYLLKYAKADNAPTIGGLPYIVTGIVGCYNDEIGNCYRVTLESTKKVTLYTEDASVIEKSNFAPATDQSMISKEKERIEVGDLVLYGSNAAGRIDSFLLLWDSRSNLDNPDEPRFGNSTVEFTYPFNTASMAWKSNIALGGLIKRKSGEALEISIDETTSIETEPNKRIQRFWWGKNMQTYVVQLNKRKPIVSKEISAGELIPGDRVVMLTGSNSGQIWVSVVYRR